jgi:thiamine-phosphate pyrophosphorylase
MTSTRNDWLGLHVLADDDPRWPLDPVEQAAAACEAGVPVVQLRTKHAGDRQTLEWAHQIRRLTRAAGVRFVVNDRFDLALRAEADGVHLGQTDIPPSALPLEVREKLAIGRSTHDREELVRAREEPVDYVAFGPVFGTGSKDSEYGARGLEALAGAVRLTAPRPLIAIGGIDEARLPELAATGVAGFAVISAVSAAKDPVATCRSLIDGFVRARQDGRPRSDAGGAR